METQSSAHNTPASSPDLPSAPAHLASVPVESILDTRTDTLCSAIRSGNLQTVQGLIASGVAVNQRSLKGELPMCIACEAGFMPIAGEYSSIRGANTGAKSFEIMRSSTAAETSRI